VDPSVSAHVDPATLAATSGTARVAMLEHVRACASCRRAIAEHDPSALFGLLALQPVPAGVLDGLAVEVARRAGHGASPYGTLAEPAAWPRRAAAAAVLALVALCGYVTVRDRPVGPPPLAMSSRRADVEVESGRGVSQVIDLTVGEAQLVMVYNGDLKL
jgi:hypothetical protein